MMSSNDILRITDTRRLSPQTTSSSGYHSDLSSSNQSPQSIHDNNSRNEKYKSTNKNFARLTCFLRKQYEKAKLKFHSSKQRSLLLVETSSKATSTTALTNNNTDNHSIQTLSTIHKRSSFIEPIKSIHISTVHNQPLKQQIYLSHRLTSFYEEDNNQVHSHSYRHLTTMSNYENISTGYSYSYAKPRYSQEYYPYQYLRKISQPSRTTYVPLSDFLSTRKSAFKPIQSLKRSQYVRSDEIIPSDDPCDLEVAQYFRHQTSQWSNPNYFDISKQDLPQVSVRKTYAETLC